MSQRADGSLLHRRLRSISALLNTLGSMVDLDSIVTIGLFTTVTMWAVKVSENKKLNGAYLLIGQSPETGALSCGTRVSAI